jgi:prepilin-type N-terminal cleavage/methylation domain-containing protein
MAMKCRGLSLVEVLSVVTILGVLAALLYPVFRSVRMRAFDVVCGSKLRQYGEALAIYRHEYGGDGVYGDLYAMGLCGAATLLDGGYISLEVVRCPVQPRRGQYAYIDGMDIRGEEFRKGMATYFAYWKDAGIVRADLNHNREPALDLGSPYLTRKGIGLYLSGNVKTLVRMGSPADLSFWHDAYEWQKYLESLQGGIRR